MASEILGTLTCPHCGNTDATIHRQGGKHSRLYYRCYVSQGSNDMRCGTVQILGPTGQKFIEKHLNKPDPIANQAPEPAPKVAIANTPPKPDPRQEPAKDGVTSSFLDRFLAGDPEE